MTSIYQMMGRKYHGRVIDYLKIRPIPGNEWKIIENIVQNGVLTNVRQLSIQVHFFQPAIQLVDTFEEYMHKIRLIKSIEDLGMVRFRSHKNPFSKRYIDFVGRRDFTCFVMVWYNPRFYDYSSKEYAS